MSIDWPFVFVMWVIIGSVMVGAFYLGVYTNKWQHKRKTR